MRCRDYLVASTSWSPSELSKPVLVLLCLPQLILREFKNLAAPSLLNNAVKANSHLLCRAHAVTLPYRVPKGLYCVFPI